MVIDGLESSGSGVEAAATFSRRDPRSGLRLPGDGDGDQGVDGYKSTVEPLFVAFPDVANTTEEIIAEGDLVATRWSAKGTHLGPFMGIPATGKRRPLTGMTIERVAGGKRVEGWGVPDMLGLLGQLGVGPGRPDAATDSRPRDPSSHRHQGDLARCRAKRNSGTRRS